MTSIPDWASGPGPGEEWYAMQISSASLNNLPSSRENADALHLQVGSKY